MKKFNYVYKITNNINGKIYIGKHSTDNLNDGYMGSGKLIKRSLNKNGLENFDKQFLAFADAEDKLNWFERYYIKKYHSTNKSIGYNLTLGGEGVLGLKQKAWNKGKNLSEETKLKIREARKGGTPWNKDKKLSEEQKQKISEKLKGRKLPETTKQKMKSRTSPNKGKSMSEEQKQKIRESLIQYNKNKNTKIS